jgi:hypothetical protein
MLCPLKLSSDEKYNANQKAKRFYCEIENEIQKEEITDPEDSIFAGQIFADMVAIVCHEKYYRYSDQEVFHFAFSVLSSLDCFHLLSIVCHNISNIMKAFVVSMKHTSFQLHHCIFPKEYLRSIHDTGYVEGDGVTLSSTRLFDFREPTDRGEWLEIFVALVEYLRSGQSKVGFLNNGIEENVIHGVKYPLLFISINC